MLKRFLLISLGGLITTVLAMTNYHRFKRIEWRPGTDVVSFEAKIGQSCDRVHQVLGDRLDRSFHAMEAAPAIVKSTSMGDEQDWFDPERRRASSARAVAGEDGHFEPYVWEQYTVAPELQRYFDLAPNERQFDWMLLHDHQPWDSEYHYRGTPAPFLSNFIVHLVCDDAASTTIQIYEYGAQICVGEWFGLHGTQGHLLPNYSFGYHPDCRLVAATRVDRAELLQQIQALF